MVAGKRSLTSIVSTDTKSDSKIISFSVAAGAFQQLLNRGFLQLDINNNLRIWLAIGWPQCCLRRMDGDGI
jgi:hypothetical protein